MKRFFFFPQTISFVIYSQAEEAITPHSGQFDGSSLNHAVFRPTQGPVDVPAVYGAVKDQSHSQEYQVKT